MAISYSRYTRCGTPAPHTSTRHVELSLFFKLFLFINRKGAVIIFTYIHLQYCVPVVSCLSFVLGETWSQDLVFQINLAGVFSDPLPFYFR